MIVRYTVWVFVSVMSFLTIITEKENYLYLAHSKLRDSGLGAEIYIGEPKKDIKGKTTIKQQDKIIWEKEFLTGEDNMSHYISNLEYHHFKYDQFCQSGQVHIHFFGTSTLSFQDKVVVNEGDEMIIEMDMFHLPLHNKLVKGDKKPVEIVQL